MAPKTRWLLVRRPDVGCHRINARRGDYFGEDDIVRLEDRYGRVGKPVT